MDIVADASVVVKWFLEEEGSQHALLLRDDFVAGDAELHAPSLLPFEVMNAIRFSPVVSAERAQKIHSALEGYGLHYHNLAGEFGRRSVRLAYASDLSVYDAAYIALAKLLNTKVVTADLQLVRAAGADGLLLSDYTSAAEP